MSKLDALILRLQCSDLDRSADKPVNIAIEALSAYDLLAEYAKHSGTCGAAWGTSAETCTCGLADAEKEVARVLEGV